MIKSTTLLFLIISIYCNSQNKTSLDTITIIKTDSIKICPFKKNCGFYKDEIVNGCHSNSDIAGIFTKAY